MTAIGRRRVAAAHRRRHFGPYAAGPRRQAGMTMIGFIMLASLVGLVAFGGIKVFPLYMQNMRLATVLDDLERDMSGSGATPQGIRLELNKRFTVEGVRLPQDSVKISQSTNGGYTVSIEHEARTPYVADIWFLIEFDKQVEIRR